MICSQCNKEFIETNHRQKYCSKECSNEVNKINKKKYSQSDGGKKVAKKITQTDEFKDNRKKYNKLYRQSIKGAGVIKKYEQTDKYKEIQNNYRQTDKYKESVKKYLQSDKAKARIKKYRESDVVKEAAKKHRQSDEAKALRVKYLQSDKYKESIKKYQKKIKGIIGPKACLHCSKEFTPLHRNKKLCSKKCIRELAKVKDQSDEIKKIRKAWRQSDKGKVALKKYEQSDNYKIPRAKYRKNRRATDPLYKLIGNMKARLGVFLRASKMKKTNRTFTMIGCTPEFLKEYLEKKFKPGMTWKNHGKYGWHIDHKLPMSLAMTPEDVEELMHYTNLQPMWATENLKKGDKII
mgnify:FL=1